MLTPDEINQRVTELGPWHYEIDLGGIVTPIFDRPSANRHRERERYLLDALLSACGGSLVGKRVLDLGCNAGYWSLKAIEHGCDFILGVDGRQRHIDQSNFVFETLGVEPGRYAFDVDDVLTVDLEAHEPFDVVLCLGLLYHVNRPVDLLERIARINSDLLIIDTTLSPLPGSAFSVTHETLDDPRYALRQELVMWPSAQAVVEMTELLGYSCVVVPPRFNDWTGAADYERGRRRVFVGAKHTPLDSIENEELRRLSTLEQEESVGTGDLHHLHEQLSASRAENAALRAQITSLT